MPTILDLFSCAGGAARGYAQAGLTVTCLDNQPQPNNPYPFIQADALHYLRDTSDTYDLYHASPPCQGYTALQNVNQNWDNWPRYITELRTLLDATGKPYIIENVIGSRDQLRNPITLCGEMFGLGVMRHRLFETNWGLTQPKHVPHRGRVRGWRHGVYYDGPYVAVYGKGGGKANLAEASEAMGIDWMTLPELVEAIPPAYTEWIGRQWLQKGVR